MTPQLPPTLERVARANPVRPDDDRGRSDDAQTALARILADQPQVRRRSALRRGRRVLIIALAALLLAVGAGLAATDPFGFFRNPNPGSALFGTDSGRHVTPPTAFRIQCPHTTGGAFRCAVGLSGRRYDLLDHVESTGANRITRANMQAAIREALARRQLTAAQAKRFDRDLAAVSDTFLAHLWTMFNYSTMSTGMTRVPPPGVPALIVCEPAGNDLSCRDLNGDAHAAISSGIYQAEPAPDWRPAPREQPDNSWALEVAILGHPPTKAELRLELDLLTTATTSTTTAGQSKPTRVPAPSR